MSHPWEPMDSGDRKVTAQPQEKLRGMNRKEPLDWCNRGLAYLRSFLWISLLLLFSCSGPPQSGSTTRGGLVPKDFRMSVGEGGGFSGIWSGYTIQGGDSVYAWNGRGPESNPGFLGLIPPDSLLALWNVLSSTHLLDSSSVEGYSNYSRFLSIRASGIERSFQCPVGDNDPGACGPASNLGARTTSMMGAFFSPR
jgi:hypothetical protein